MKYINVLFMSFFLLTAVVIIGCSDSSTKLDLEAFATEKALEYRTGEFEIVKDGEDIVIVEKKNELVQNFFLLQGVDQNIHFDLNRKIEIAFGSHDIFILFGGQDLAYYSINSHQIEGIDNAFKINGKGFTITEINVDYKSDKFVDNVRSNSLSSTLYSLNTSDDINAKFNIQPFGIDPCNFCGSGGQGSTSCSISNGAGPVKISCTVNCSADYYACCSVLTGCHCCG